MSAVDDMTTEQLEAEVARIEGMIALAESDPHAFLWTIDPELAEKQDRLARRLANAEAELARVKAERAELAARVGRQVAIIRPAAGAQWKPPHRGEA